MSLEFCSCVLNLDTGEFALCNPCEMTFDNYPKLCLLPVHSYCDEGFCVVGNSDYCDPLKVCERECDFRTGQCESCSWRRLYKFKRARLCSRNKISVPGFSPTHTLCLGYILNFLADMPVEEFKFSLCDACFKDKNKHYSHYKRFSDDPELAFDRRLGREIELNRRYKFTQEFIQYLDGGHANIEKVHHHEISEQWPRPRGFKNLSGKLYDREIIEYNKFTLDMYSLDVLHKRVFLNEPVPNDVFVKNSCGKCSFKIIKMNITINKLNTSTLGVWVNEWSNGSDDSFDSKNYPHLLSRHILDRQFYPDGFDTESSVIDTYAVPDYLDLELHGANNNRQPKIVSASFFSTAPARCYFCEYGFDVDHFYFENHNTGHHVSFNEEGVLTDRPRSHGSTRTIGAADEEEENWDDDDEVLPPPYNNDYIEENWGDGTPPVPFGTEMEEHVHGVIAELEEYIYNSDNFSDTNENNIIVVDDSDTSSISSVESGWSDDCFEEKRVADTEVDMEYYLYSSDTDDGESELYVEDDESDCFEVFSPIRNDTLTS